MFFSRFFAVFHLVFFPDVVQKETLGEVKN